MSMNITIPPEQLSAVVAEAIFKSLTEDRQAEILKAAITYLITPPRDAHSYSGTRQSPLLSAFCDAANVVARRVATERLEKDPQFMAAVDELIVDAWKSLTVDRSVLVEKIASAMSSALAKDRY